MTRSRNLTPISIEQIVLILDGRSARLTWGLLILVVAGHLRGAYSTVFYIGWSTFNSFCRLRWLLSASMSTSFSRSDALEPSSTRCSQYSTAFFMNQCGVRSRVAAACLILFLVEGSSLMPDVDELTRIFLSQYLKRLWWLPDTQSLSHCSDRQAASRCTRWASRTGRCGYPVPVQEGTGRTSGTPGKSLP